MATGIRETEVEYPSSDGKPMAETDIHRDLILDLIRTLEGYYADRQDVYVSGNLMVFYEPGDRRKFLAPDCFVAFGVPKRSRDYYRVWEEGGRFPSVVFEVTSRTTRDDDLTDKLAVYRDTWRVDEYFLFDPRGEYLSPSLQGYRWTDGDFVPMEMIGGQSLFSPRLNLFLEGHGSRLLLIEAGSYRRLYTPELQRAMDEIKRRRQAEAAQQVAEARAAAAEAEVARLKAELDSLRNPPPAT